jgi:hypothetical protein
MLFDGCLATSAVKDAGATESTSPKLEIPVRSSTRDRRSSLTIRRTADPTCSDLLAHARVPQTRSRGFRADRLGIDTRHLLGTRDRREKSEADRRARLAIQLNRRVRELGAVSPESAVHEIRRALRRRGGIRRQPQRQCDLLRHRCRACADDQHGHRQQGAHGSTHGCSPAVNGSDRRDQSW